MAVTSPPQRIPNVDEAQVPEAKLWGYVLNPNHPEGGPKARVFAAVLGIRRADWQHLRDQLLNGVRTAPARRIRSTEWGDLYEAAINVTGPTGRTHQVRTAWIIRPADSRPQLVTAYVDLP